MTQLHAILSDLLIAALDDEHIRLGPVTERRVLARMVELAELAGVELVHSPPPPEKPGHIVTDSGRFQ